MGLSTRMFLSKRVRKRESNPYHFITLKDISKRLFRQQH